MFRPLVLLSASLALMTVGLAAPAHAAEIPSAPTVTSSTGGDGFLYTSWTAPASTGDSAIARYLISAYDAGTDAFVNSTTCTPAACLAAPLDVATGSYNVTVKAENATGYGPESAAFGPVSVSDVRPDGVPAAPTNVVVQGVNNGLDVSWTNPAGTLIRYLVLCYTATSPPVRVSGISSSSVVGATTCPITDAGTNSYTAEVAVESSGGWSAWSAMSAPAAAVPGRLGAPALGGVFAGVSKITMYWNAPFGAPVGIPYEIEQSADNGATWDPSTVTTLPPPSPDITTYFGADITNLAPGTAYLLRVRAVNDTVSPSVPGLWLTLASTVTPNGPFQTVTWSPTNTSVTGTSGTITPDAAATTNGDGAISYAVSGAGTTGCTVDPASGVVTYGAAGSCIVTATAAQTAAYSVGAASVTFTITAPASGGGGSGGGGSTTPPVVEVPPTTPVVETPPVTPAPTPPAPPVAPNPPVAVSVAPGIVVVSAEVAAVTTPRVMKNDATPKMGGAPVVLAAPLKPLSLVASGLTAGTTYTVKIKVNGRYVDLGQAQGGADGSAQLPVFRTAKPGTYTIAIVDPATGETRYLKVKVGKKRA